MLEVVRKMLVWYPHVRSRVDGQVHVDFTNGESTDIPLETTLWYEPWFMDRGSLLFSCPESGRAKICTEADVIRFPDGVEDSVMPCLD